MTDPYSLQDSSLIAVFDAARDLWSDQFAIVVSCLPDQVGFKTSVVIGGDIELGVSADADPVAAISLSLHRATTAFRAALDEDELAPVAEDDD